MNSEEITAIEWQCQQLLFKATRLMDEARWQDYTNCFTEDAILARPSDPDNPFKGRSEILASLEARPPRLTCHFLTNCSFDIKHTASVLAHSRVLLMAASPSADRPAPANSALLAGTFVDRLVNTGSEWLIARRQGSIELSYNPVAT